MGRVFNMLLLATSTPIDHQDGIPLEGQWAWTASQGRMCKFLGWGGLRTGQLFLSL